MQTADPLLLVVMVVLAVAVLALLMWLGQRGKNARADEGAPVASPTPTTTPTPTTAPAGLAGVQQALAAGRKIEAIKLYRELTGLGLKESKDAVDAMQAGAPAAFVAPALAPSPQGMDEVVRLARTGQLIMAIKLHRELTGMGLKDSKDAVERLRDGR